MSNRIIASLIFASSVFAVGQTAPPQAGAEPVAVFDTTAGKLTCKLFPKQAPKTVANFIGLATGKKDWTDPKTHQVKHGVALYDGTIFHRVIPRFMIQGGDPLGIGIGGPGYSFEDEFSSDLQFDKPGLLAMANSGPNTNGSQFFITEVPTPHLNGHHTIFGQCDDASVELVKQIARTETGANNHPVADIKIIHIAITGAGSSGPAPSKPASPAAPGKSSAPKSGQAGGGEK